MNITEQSILLCNARTYFNTSNILTCIKVCTRITYKSIYRSFVPHYVYFLNKLLSIGKRRQYETLPSLLTLCGYPFVDQEFWIHVSWHCCLRGSMSADIFHSYVPKRSWTYTTIIRFNFIKIRFIASSSCSAVDAPFAEDNRPMKELER